MRVAVIGGGIAGVAAAHALTSARTDVRVDLYEGSPRLGGKLLLGTVADITVDVGAESILSRRPEGVDLARAVGLGMRIVHPEPVGASIWTHGALRPLPPTVMGIPANLDALAASGLVPHQIWEVADRNLGEGGAQLPKSGGDVSVAAYVRTRLGDVVGSEVVDRLIEPLLGGVYAGRTEDLSVAAAAPQIVALGDDLIEAASRRPRSDVPVFSGLAGGVGQLPGAVAVATASRVHLNATVRQLTQTESGWMLTVGPTTGPDNVDVDAVIVATPGPATSRLLGAVAPRAAHEIGGIDYASMAIITLALPTDGFARRLEGSGFLVPAVDDKAIKAATFSTSKWAWLADAAGPDMTILRCSIGRAGESSMLHASDSDLVAAAVRDLREAVGRTGAPLDAHVQRWGGALPQYNVGHLARVETVHTDIAGVRGLEVCGAAYEGLGIPAVIASAQRAAARLLASLGTMEP